MKLEPSKFFCFGLGLTGTALARALASRKWTMAGTHRDEPPDAPVLSSGISVLRFDGTDAPEPVVQEILRATHVLVTIPPQKDRGDVVLAHFREHLANLPTLRWLGYLSTTGVYGNRDGDWVDETSELRPQLDHQKRRAEAEQQWLDLFRQFQVPVHIFRLGGIYGPGRNLLQRVKDGTARRIDVPGLVFNRIHVQDVVQALMASMARPQPGSVYNVADDCPSSPVEAVAFACELLGAPVPPLVALDAAELSGMARAFYTTNKRVRNQKIKTELGVKLLYPDYRSGLRALLPEETET